MEIALLGLKGLDTNDSAQKPSRKLPGSFSGLNLMCRMFIAFKHFATDRDSGSDVARDYRAAQEFVGSQKPDGASRVLGR